MTQHYDPSDQENYEDISKVGEGAAIGSDENDEDSDEDLGNDLGEDLGLACGVRARSTANRSEDLANSEASTHGPRFGRPGHICAQHCTA